MRQYHLGNAGPVSIIGCLLCGFYSIFNVRFTLLETLNKTPKNKHRLI